MAKLPRTMAKKKNTEERKGQNLVVRVSDAEMESYEKAAERDERALSNWVRVVLNREIKRLEQSSE